jgi:hypothetical protein
VTPGLYETVIARRNDRAALNFLEFVEEMA